MKECNAISFLQARDLPCLQSINQTPYRKWLKRKTSFIKSTHETLPWMEGRETVPISVSKSHNQRPGSYKTVHLIA